VEFEAEGIIRKERPSDERGEEFTTEIAEVSRESGEKRLA